MEHLVVHLTNEAILGGPVQFRWMYQYERKLGRLKRTIKNKSRVEGSIGVRVDPKTHMVDVKPTSIGCENDPFILASQAQQVYYTSYPSKAKELKGWLAVVKTTPRGIYELAEDVTEVDDDNNVDEEKFFQENERLECTITEDLQPISFVQGDVEEVGDMNEDNDDIQ
ncbi:hypothetical protein QVD17_28405 [Tagetes erecta]|uniref:DUF4218 domain-containing protein n=1 Tax=Tagetes erecta TaxID=13708 RepID=A0AAD8KAD5_TARER|nr:hypothetical protein QVD17_28405 [Tagetes erecta]